MKTKLNTVSIKLIKALVSVSKTYWQARLKAEKEGLKAAQVFGSISAELELSDALGMDSDDIRPYIVDLIREKISEEECVQLIINNYEEFYSERLLKNEMIMEDFFREINYKIQEGELPVYQKGMTVIIVPTENNTWEVAVKDENNIFVSEVSKSDFDTKLEAMEYVIQLNKKYFITEVLI